MSENLRTRGAAARSRVRSIVPTILMILISVMIVRDILVRRWAAATPPVSDVTERSR
jgi:predicted lysophospholipase L1 biosynthesis ABC-type transport system permease subunit